MSNILRAESPTLSFDSDSDLFENEELSFTEAPYDLYYDEKGTSGESLLVMKKGERLPCVTKYKKKSTWSYALKFRYIFFSSK